jgi:CheY-like chemotaxis protein
MVGSGLDRIMVSRVILCYHGVWCADSPHTVQQFLLGGDGVTQPAPTILVVDDNDDIRDTLQLLFEEEGYSVQLAANGREALELLRASATPRIVLLDWFMPDLTGERVLQIVAADAVLAQRHVFIVMSAIAPATVHLDGVPPTLITARVEKPFDIGTLLDVVKTASQDIRVRTDQVTQATRRTPVVSRPARTGTA